jgi:protein TonB
MNTATIPMMYDNREWVARGGSIFLGVLLVFAISHMAIRHEAMPTEEPIKISLAEPPVELPKPVEPPPPVEQPKPQELPPKPVTPEPVRQQQASPVAAKPSPVPEANPVSVPNAPVEPQAKTIPKAEPAPIQRNAAAEGRFAQEVRTQIERKKIFPDSARDLGMSGVVEVVYMLDRAGSLVRADVATSSGHPLLDQAALRAIRSASFAAFPADAWVGENQKEFRTKLVFSINY